MRDLWQEFCATVERVPDRAALIRGDDSVTYAEWRSRADDYRRVLQTIGVRKGDRILLWVTNTFDIAAALTATWAEGAIATIMDAGCKESQFAHALAVTEPVALVFDDQPPPSGVESAVVSIAVREVEHGVSPAASSAVRSLPTEPASIVFTSGSTGKPKGVIQSHGNLSRGCRAVASYLGLRDDDRILCPVPWSFDYGYGQMLTTVVFGVTQVIPVAFNPFGVCDAIERHKPSILAGVSSMFTYLVSGLSPIRTTDGSSVRLVTNTGSTVPKPTLAALREVFGNSHFILNYGLTETYRSCYLPPEALESRPDSIGIPIPGVDIVIVREDGSLADPGEEGEIVHRGDYVCLGYWNNPDATSKSLRCDPVMTSAVPNPPKALFTGDMGWRDADGFVYFVGRRDHQLKSMGVRVSAGEVEQLIHESGFVLEAAVFGMPHELMGQEVFAAVVLKPETGASEQKLRRYCLRAMSQYMQPRRYMVLESMPRTTTGKVNYPELASIAARC